MIFKLLSCESFGSLNEALKINYLKRLSLHIDNMWGSIEDRLFLISQLKLCLELYSKNTSKKSLLKNPDKLLAILKHKNLDQTQFLAVLIPIERCFGKEPLDSDFLVDTLDLVDGSKPTATFPLNVICDNIRSSFNLGSIFRTAECVGVESVSLCGYTPTPENEKVAKTSMGIASFVKWHYEKSIYHEIQSQKDRGVKIIALETADPSESLFELDMTFPSAVVLGNEKHGLSTEILALCDAVCRIPVFGIKNSLNVANAFSVFAFEARRQYSLLGN